MNCTRLIIRYTFGSHFLQRSLYICRTYKFLTSYFSNCAVWILCVISLERAAVTKHYVLTQNVFSRKHSYCTLLIIYTILFFLNIHYLIFFGSKQEDDELWTIDETETGLMIVCASNLVRETRNSYEYFLIYYFSWMDFFINSLIPFLIILIANTSVMYSVCKSRIGMKQMGMRQTRSPRDTQLAYILFVSTFLFLLLTFPLKVFSVVEPYLNYEQKYLILLDGIMRFLLYIDHGCGFYLYTFTGELFRRELRKFIFHCLSILFRRQNLNWNRVESRRFSELSGSNGVPISCTVHSPIQPIPFQLKDSTSSGPTIKLATYSIKTQRSSYHQCVPVKTMLTNTLSNSSTRFIERQNPYHHTKVHGLVKRHSSSCFEAQYRVSTVPLHSENCVVHVDRERNSDII